MQNLEGSRKIVSKGGDRSRGRHEGSFSSGYYIEVEVPVV